MKTLPDALRPLAAYNQFIVCQFVPDTSRPGKTHKYPIDPTTGQKVDASDSRAWLSFDQAAMVARAFGESFGVGFTFTEADPFFFFDIDSCITPTGYKPIVADLISHVPGAAVEISQSGNGLHIIGTGTPVTKSADRRKKDRTGTEFDLYTEKRFVALTGTGITGTANGVDHSAGLEAVVQKYLRLDTPVNGNLPGWTTEPRADWKGSKDDDELVARFCKSASISAAFGGRCTPGSLWIADIDELAKHYPPDRNGNGAYNASDADSALAQHLAFWTGCDCERMLRLMKRSSLVREKWERDDYLRNTIMRVVARQEKVLIDKPVDVPAPATNEARQIDGSTFLSAQDMAELFKGCVYTTLQNAIMIPGGHMLNAERFNVHFGGYTFPMDGANAGKTRKAWEAFTQSQVYRFPKVRATTFRPDWEPGHVQDNVVNIYARPEIKRAAGDASPFLNHLAKMLPNERDRHILLCYMASLVQNQGVKFKWCPFIQGVEGNGKTMCSLVVAYAVGEAYTVLPTPARMTGQFNSWEANNIFAMVEDIYIPEQQRSTWEIFKPMITGERRSVELKGVDMETMRICINYILNSNHLNAIPISKNGRRAAPFITAQQNVEDLTRDGMGGDYMPNLYDWLKREGYAFVAELLHTMKIDPEFDPAGKCQRAPITSSTELAIEASQGKVEQDIMEAVEQDMPGFCGGWISSMALDKLLERTRIPPNGRKAILERLGYVWHPHLTSGRVNSVIEPDKGKPKLFIKVGHKDVMITEPAAIARAYTEAQK